MTAAVVDQWDGLPPDDPYGQEPAAVRAGGLADRLLSRDALAALPAPEPLIGGTVDRRTVVVVAGAYGTLKSFLLQDWAGCVATGKSWQGRTVESGRVLYIAAEGAYGLHSRLAAWEYAWQQTITSDRLRVLPVPANLTDRRQVDELCDLAQECTLVVVDTLARCLVGADENSARDMGLAVDSLYRVRDATGDGTVVVAHHTGKDRTTIRGSSALEAGVDTVYTTEGGAAQMTLKRTKRKDGPLEDTVSLALETVLQSGCIVSSSPLDMRPTATELLSTYLSTFGTIGATKVELRNVSEMVPSTFHRALKDLLTTGRLVNTGTAQRPFYKPAGAA